MNKFLSKKVIFFIVIIIIIFVTGSIITLTLATNNLNNNNINNEKIDLQILYLDNKITSLVNMINNIDYNNQNIFRKQNEIDWNNIEKDIIELYESWNSIIIDLNNANIKNTKLTEFGRILDETTISIKNKNKDETLANLCDLYYLIAQYIDLYNSNVEMKNNIYTKYYLIKSLFILNNTNNDNNWTLVLENIINAEKVYYKNINSIDNFNNHFKKNRIYVSIKELENISRTKDIDLFYFKYGIVMKNLN